MNTPVGSRITRIFIDEAHAIYLDPMQTRAKETFAPLKAVISSRKVPLIFLTATLSPKHEQYFMREAQIKPDTKVIRMDGDRPNLAQYIIKPRETVPADEVLKNLIWNLKFHLANQAKQGNSELAIVFVTSKKEVETIGSDCGILTYHSKMEEAQKRDNLAQWGFNDAWIMVCTTALATGIDKSNVRYCIMLESKFGIYNYVQTLGRAGRDGSTSFIIVIHDDNVNASVGNTVTKAQIDSINDMGEFLQTNRCLRQFLSNVMDNGTTCCKPQSKTACSSKECRAGPLFAQIKRWAYNKHADAERSAAALSKPWTAMPLLGLSNMIEVRAICKLARRQE